jgi:hypothetical protein
MTVPTEAQTYRSKPVEIEAIQWNGKNFDDVSRFAEDGFNSGTDEDGLWAEVYDYLQKVWVPVNLQDYIIKGTQDEFYPCASSVFQRKYEPVVTPEGELGLYEGEMEK